MAWESRFKQKFRICLEHIYTYSQLPLSSHSPRAVFSAWRSHSCHSLVTHLGDVFSKEVSLQREWSHTNDFRWQHDLPVSWVGVRAINKLRIKWFVISVFQYRWNEWLPRYNGTRKTCSTHAHTYYNLVHKCSSELWTWHLATTQHGQTHWEQQQQMPYQTYTFSSMYNVHEMYAILYYLCHLLWLIHCPSLLHKKHIDAVLQGFFFYSC